MKSFLNWITAFLLCAGALFPYAALAIVPNDPFLNEQWSLQKIHAPQAWDRTTGSPDVVVAVIDTGVDIYNADLKENIWTNPKEIMGNHLDDDQNGYIDDLHGWNFVNNSNDVRPWGNATDTDAFLHGTLVSSIIGATGNNGIGIAGIAWNVKIMPLVALTAYGTGSTTDVAHAVRYAADNGANIINLSIEGDIRDPELDNAIAYARSMGILTVTVAGNGHVDEKNPDAAAVGNDLDQAPVYPACEAPDGLYGTLTVSATDQEDRKASFANYGSCVDLVAPGVDLFGARPEASGARGETSSTPIYIGGFDGTSVAAPIVSGVAALLKSIHPNWGASELRQRLIASAVPIDQLNAVAFRGKLGAGRVDAANALDDAKFVTSTAEKLSLEATIPGERTRVRWLSDTEILEVSPFGVSDTHGAMTAFSDLDGDGTPEIAAIPASGSVTEMVIYGRDGQERKRISLPYPAADGAVIVGTVDGFVAADPNTGQAWGIDRSFVVHPFLPYGPNYKNGMDLVAIGGEAGFVPRNGGGRLVVSNADGVQLVSAFPFGMTPSGRWSIATAVMNGKTMLIMSGLSGTKMIASDTLGQIGWQDVTFGELEQMAIRSSVGMLGETTSTRAYDVWPH